MRAVICQNPNCRYRGRPKKEARGSMVVLLILLLVFFPLGLLYLVMQYGSTYRCPKCRMSLKV